MSRRFNNEKTQTNQRNHGLERERSVDSELHVHLPHHGIQVNAVGTRSRQRHVQVGEAVSARDSEISMNFFPNTPQNFYCRLQSHRFTDPSSVIRSSQFGRLTSIPATSYFIHVCT